MPKLKLLETLNLMNKAALAAGEVILKIYNQPILSIKKQDNSPVTIADKLSEEIIINILAQANIPILAEEAACNGYIPKLGNRFFVVDPLDGTKEFIKKNDEFTVNIALIENGVPICGIVTAPALKQGYIGSKNGAFSFSIIKNKQGKLKPINVNKKDALNIVTSRSHKNQILENFLEEITKSGIIVNENISVGSSLKFCLLASGKAQLYPRLNSTCEWDTAAGQAILKAAGGIVLTANGKELFYEKEDENFFNPFFIAASDKKLGLKVIKLIQEKNG